MQVPVSDGIDKAVVALAATGDRRRPRVLKGGPVPARETA